MIYLNCFSLEILTFLHVETLKVKKLTNKTFLHLRSVLFSTLHQFNQQAANVTHESYLCHRENDRISSELNTPDDYVVGI